MRGFFFVLRCVITDANSSSVQSFCLLPDALQNFFRDFTALFITAVCRSNPAIHPFAEQITPLFLFKQLRCVIACDRHRLRRRLCYDRFIHHIGHRRGLPNPHRPSAGRIYQLIDDQHIFAECHDLLDRNQNPLADAFSSTSQVLIGLIRQSRFPRLCRPYDQNVSMSGNRLP